MKRLIYQVYVGKENNLYNTCVDSVKKYCKKFEIDHIVQREPILKIVPDITCTNRNPRAWQDFGGYLPIFEKENAFDYLDTYDQIVILDSDIFIKNTAPNLFEYIEPQSDFAGVAEREMPLKNKNKIKKYSHDQYIELSKEVDFKPNKFGFEYFNMGLMLLNKSILKYLKNQTAEEFLKRPEFKNFIDGKGNWKWSTDQTLLNYWIKKENMSVQNLDWKWNALYSAVSDDKLKEAYFIHFFLKKKLPNNGENIKEILERL
jgi:hypothetical protein